MKRCFWLIGLVLSASAIALADSSLERVLKRVPDDTGAIVIIPSLESLNKGFTSFGKAIGVEDLANFDAIKNMDFEDEIGKAASEVVDIKGAFVLTMTIDAEQGVAIVELTDVSQVEKTEGATKGDDGVYTIKREFGEKYFAIDGKLAIFANDKSVVQSALKSQGKFGETVSKTTGPLLEKSQGLIYVDAVAMKSKFDEGFASFEAMAPMMAAMMGPQGASAGSAITFLVSEIKSIAADSRAWVFAGRLGTDGFGITAHAAFKPDSKTAAYMKDVKPGKGNILASLPDERSLFTMAYDFVAPAHSESISEKLAKVMIPEMKFDDPSERERLEAAVKRSVESAKAITGMSMAFTMTPEKKILTSGVMQTADSGLVMKNFEAANEMSQLMSKAFGGGAMKWTVATAKESIGGAEAVVSNIELQSDDPNVTQMLEMMYGGAKMTSIAAVAKDAVVYASGSADAAKAQVEKLLKQKGPGLSGNSEVKAALATISPKPQGVVLVDLAQAFEWGMGIAGSMGMPIPPAKLDPAAKALAAFAVYMEPESARMELSVPSQTLKALMDAMKKMQEDSSEAAGDGAT
ncbi:MAG: hypothetical protein JNG88_04115 [Phycisphaerales bacterium]|nr:hypothetical protein [Phycisphaerales bacterium]